MNWQWLYTSFEGRIGRKQFWIGLVILAVVAIVIYMVVGPLVGASMFAGMSAVSADGTIDVDAFQAAMSRANWFALVMFIVFAWPGIALYVKRRHDRGSSGLDVWVFYGLQGLSTLLAALGLTMSMTDMGGMSIPQPNIIGTVLGLVAALLALYLIIVCGFLKGTAGENAYGPDPLA